MIVQITQLAVGEQAAMFALLFVFVALCFALWTDGQQTRLLYLVLPLCGFPL